MIRKSIALTAILSSAICLGASAQTARRRGPIVRQVDHILVESGNPKSLFSLFVDTLQFPEAWPLADNQGFVSGGVGTGNVNLEFFRYAESKKVPSRRIPEARYFGLAFQPYPLSDALREMQVDEIAYDPPEPYVARLPKGSQGVLWTTVALPAFSRPGMSIFLYEYSPAFLNVEVQRKQQGNRLALNNGGPLGFQTVQEVVIGTTDLQRDKTAWERLLGKPTASGNWHVGAGPAIRLVSDSRDRIVEVIFEVKSLDLAKAFLKKQKLLGSVSSREIFLDPLKVQGLRIRLVDQKR